jgi:hypothetical protein
MEKEFIFGDSFFPTDEDLKQEEEKVCERCQGTGKIEVDYGDGREEKCECQLGFEPDCGPDLTDE